MTDHDLEEALGICCGDTTAIRDHIHTTLRLLHLRREINSQDRGKGDGWARATEQIAEHLGGNLYGPMEAVYLHYLDRLDLIEHGSGIAGSWLTDLGEQVLEELNKRKPLDMIVASTE